MSATASFRLVEYTNTHAIDMLEQLLVRLKSGETIAIGVIEVRKDKTVADGWSSGPKGEGMYHFLNSAAARLACRLASEEDAN